MTLIHVLVDPDDPQLQIEGTLYAVAADGSAEEHWLTLIGASIEGHSATEDYLDHDPYGLRPTQWDCATFAADLTLIARVYEFGSTRMDCLAVGLDPAGVVAGDYTLRPPPSARDEITDCRVE